MKSDEISFHLLLLVFAVGAVAVVLYHHAAATNQILGALGGANVGAGGNAVGNPAAAAASLGVPVSLAGTPTVGQAGSSQPPGVVPININPGYLLQ